MKERPREMTTDEVRTKFVAYVRSCIDYAESSDGWPTLREKLEGLAFSILVGLDGEAGSLPAFIVAPAPGLQDEVFHRTHGENWYPYNGDCDDAINADISGSLHDELVQK